MESSQKKIPDIPNSQLPLPSLGQLLLFCLLLGWLAFAPLLTESLAALLPATWPALASQSLAVVFLTALLLIPFAGFTILVRSRGWKNLWPFALTLLMTCFYLIIAATIRALTKPAETAYELPLLSETTLRLTLLTFAGLGIGSFGLVRAGVPFSAKGLLRIFGFNAPRLTGLLTAFSLIALLTIGWPLTGSLGDSWVSLHILSQTLAITLPEEIFFRGAILGLLTYTFPHRKVLAALVALLTYVAFTPSLIVPHHEWSKLLFLISAVPFALMTTELRALTGSIWAGILFAWVYRAAPLLFTDPRVELAQIVQPWQTAAHLWMLIGAGGLALILFGSRKWLAPRWRLARPTITMAAVGATLFFWGMWSSLWVVAGYPGLHNDGFLIIMAEQADLSGAEKIDEPLARRAFVRDRLIETAERTQPPVRQALDAAGFDYRPFYLINMIRVEGHHRQMADFADLPGVGRVMLNPNVRPYPFKALNLGYGGSGDETPSVGWNISQTQADQVWEMGFSGQGIVVAGQDTGYDWQHPALRRAYRGLNDSGEVNHNYNWHDAWDDKPAPFDDDSHGTHTMGTILGDDGQGNQIGMAPGAKWMGCRNMRRGLGNPASYTDCMEFFLAPYPLGGDPFTDGDVSLGPNVVNNSWGCPDIEGCDDDVLAPATDALRAAGIMMIVSAGNDGPGCQTAIEPPARYDSVFSVGATNDLGRITGFSSRGPVPDTPPLLKPDAVAPGANVRSSLPAGRYGLADGTSMASPHVTGLVALIWSANPNLIGQIDQTKEIIRQSARAVAVSAACDIQNQSLDELSLLEQVEALDNPNVCACGEAVGVPNNVYGWGEIDALKAVELALKRDRDSE